MQGSRRGDCGSDGLWVLVDLGGHGMGCGLVFRWLNRCWYGDWMAGLVVLVFGGMGWAVDYWFVGGFCNRWFQQLVVSAISICWWFLQSVLCLVWCLLVIGGFGFFFFPFFVGGFCLGGVCVMVGWWWLLPCWVCVVVVVVEGVKVEVVVVGVVDFFLVVRYIILL